MEELFIVIAIYIIFTFITYAIISMLVNINIGADDEFDKAMLDNGSRMFAILIVSVLWPITVPIIFINNLKKRGDK